MANIKRTASQQFLFSLVEDRPEKGSAVASKVIEHIREGFRWAEVQPYQAAFQIKDKLFAKIIGISDRTLTRTRKNRVALDPIASDRLYRTAKVLNLAVEVFEDFPRAVHWLQREQPGLGGMVPFTLLDTEPGTQAVETLLTQLEYSVLP